MRGCQPWLTQSSSGFMAMCLWHVPVNNCSCGSGWRPSSGTAAGCEVLGTGWGHGCYLHLDSHLSPNILLAVRSLFHHKS